MTTLRERVSGLAAQTILKRQAVRLARQQNAVDEEAFGVRMRRARGRQDKTLGQLSEEIGMNATHLGGIETGKTKIDDRIAILRAIVEALGGRFILKFPGEQI